jgi:hypothetical protein
MKNRKRVLFRKYRLHSVSLTTDTWTSVATESYITVTEHHLTDNWDMKSNVPSERIFSSAGLIVTKLRNRLSFEVVDQILFLNKNKIKVPRNEPHTTD